MKNKLIKKGVNDNNIIKITPAINLNLFVRNIEFKFNNNFVTDDNYKTWFTPNEKMIHILEKHETRCCFHCCVFIRF